MTCTWLRRLALAIALPALALSLSACGGGSIESKLTPQRFVVFGGARADVGIGNTRYTVNDASVNTWVEETAADYGVAIKPADQGGTGWARGNARIVGKPDAAGNAATLTLKEQIDAFLAKDKLASNDLAVVDAGISDIVYQMNVFLAGAQTQDQMIANVQQAGRDLGAQIRRLVDAGGSHVLVTGPYNVGKSIWATQINRVDLLTNASLRFNEALLISIVDLGSSVLYVDSQLYFNLLISAPAGYNLTDATKIVCTSVDPGPGIGTGAGKVNSALCTPQTVLAGVDYNRYAFADALYFTPAANRLFGDYVRDRLKQRW